MLDANHNQIIMDNNQDAAAVIGDDHNLVQQQAPQLILQLIDALCSYSYVRNKN